LRGEIRIGALDPWVRGLNPDPYLPITEKPPVTQINRVRCSASGEDLATSGKVINLIESRLLTSSQSTKGPNREEFTQLFDLHTIPGF
jgi:hypothetical protein